MYKGGGGGKNIIIERMERNKHDRDMKLLENIIDQQFNLLMVPHK